MKIRKAMNCGFTHQIGGLRATRVCVYVVLLSLFSVSVIGQDITTGLDFSGNVNDESGNGNNGIVNGATLTTDRFDNANSAYSFNGVDDWIRDYKIKGTGDGRYAFSEPFSIKRKVPLIFWLVPAAVTGGTVAIIVGSSGDNEQDNLIPEPIGPD